MAEKMIKIEIDDKQLKDLLQKYFQKTTNTKPLMVSIAETMNEAVAQNLEEEGRPTKWPDLSEITKRKRAAEGKWPGKILQVSGQLKSSIQSYATNNTAMVGTNKVYAAIHHFGGKAGKNRKVEIPKRPYMQLTEEDMDKIKKIVLDYLSEV